MKLGDLRAEFKEQWLKAFPVRGLPEGSIFCCRSGFFRNSGGVHRWVGSATVIVWPGR